MKNDGKKKQAKPAIKFGEGIPGPNELMKELQPNPIDQPEENAETESKKEEVKDETHVAKETVEKKPVDFDKKEKDHPISKDDQEIPDLIKFEEEMKEYFDQLNWRPKSELVTNVPVPLPNPVYQKLKELEPYYTLKQKGFLQEVVTRAVINEVKRMIVEVKTKNLKKKRAR